MNPQEGLAGRRSATLVTLLDLKRSANIESMLSKLGTDPPPPPFPASFTPTALEPPSPACLDGTNPQIRRRFRDPVLGRKYAPKP